MRSIVFATLALLAPAELLAQPAVLVYQDGRVAAHPGERPVAPGELRGLDHAWVWSEHSAPRRVEASDFGKEPPVADRQRLEVRVAHAGEQRLPSLRVLAAPVAMWQEIPEALLPEWPLPETGRLAIPRDPGRPWRLRLVGRGVGSWWLDVGAGLRVGTLVPVAAEDRVIEIIDAQRLTLPQAAVTLLSSVPQRAGVLAQYRCDERGQVHFPSLPDNAKVTLIAGEARHAPAALSAWPSAWPRQLRLAPGQSAGGRFVDPEGAPVPGVEVRADAWISAGIGGTVARHAVSDERGRWLLETLPRGTVALAAAATGFVPFQLQIELAEEAVDLGKIELSPGQSLAILVVDEEDTPVAAVTLNAGPDRRAVTDRHGKAVLADVPLSRGFEIAARADGYLPAESSVRPPLPEELLLTLRRAFRVEGRFVDQEGVGVAGGTARVEIGDRYADHELRYDGRFSLELPPGGTARLTLRSAATRELAVAVEPGSGGETRDLGDLRAPPGVRLHGRLLRATDATPVAGATVWAPRPSAQGDVVAWAQRDLVAATSRSDGSFELSGLPRGPMLLRIDAPGLARTHLPIEPETWELDLGEVFMSAGARVLVFAGEETEGAEARIDLRNDWLELDMLTATVTADDQAVVPHVPVGTATVTVLRGRELLCEERIEIAEGDDSLTVDCQRNVVRVSGTVRVGGEPAGPGQLSWLPAGGPMVQAIIFNRSTALGVRQQQTFGGGRPQVDVDVDAAGSFWTEKLRPGTWAVSWLPSTGSMTAPETIELPDVAEHDIRLSFGGLTLTGLVIDTDERPVAGARVRESGGAAFAFSRADGSFLLVGLEPGPYQLYARFEALSSQVVEAVVRPDRESDPVVLVLAERPAKEVEILVLGDDGEPAAGAFVFIERDDHQIRMLTTDLDGRASLALRPPDPEGLRFARVSDGQWALGSWLSLEQAREGVTLAPQDTGSVRIASRELHGATVIFTADGWDLSWLLTRIGARPVVSPDLPLEIRGIPEGSYKLALGDFTADIAVRHGDQTEIEVP